ncbi:MAG: aspartate 1-decarboxylase [Anaerolineales bacterium]|jgi:aspartate 1-decarboxylase
MMDDKTPPIMRTLLGGKIHRARVTAAAMDYEGSITIDRALLEAAGIGEFERVQVVDLENGNRLETYVLPAPHRSGVIQVNGAAAHLIFQGDRIIIMSYVLVPEPLPAGYHPRVVLVDDSNQIREVRRAPVH